MKYEIELLESINYYLKEIYTILINNERDKQKDLIKEIENSINNRE